MKKKHLGNSGLEIPSLCIGGNVFGWTLNEKQSFYILDAFLERGFNFIDTANNYSHWVPGNTGYESETIIGKWIKARNNRDKLIIATKIGGRNMPNGWKRANASASHILEQTDASLQRLGIETVDLIQLHRDDKITPVKETLEAFDRLIKEGKTKNIGVSNISKERLIESMETAEKMDLPKYQSLQTLYSLVERKEYETEYRETVKKYGLGVLGYYALASGFLSGKYRSEADLNKSIRGGDVKKYLNKKGLEILRALDEFAEEYQTEPAVIALSWMKHQPDISVPIVSATRLEHVESIAKAAEIALSEAAVRKLNEVSLFD